MPVIIKEMKHGWHYLAPFTQSDMQSNKYYEKCPVCASKSEVTPLVNLGNPAWPDSVHLVQCPDCEAIYYQNPPNEKFINKFYEEIWNTQDGESVAKTISASRKKSHRFARMLADLGYENKNARILDIGCGLGNLMAGLQAAGFKDLWGTEMSPYRVKMSSKRFPDRIFSGGYKGVPDDMKFDIIYANHVFEHIFQPGEAFVWMKEHLTEAGIIVLSVPDARFETVMGQVLFLPHIFSFGHQSFDELAKKNEMRAMFWRADRFWDMTCVFTDKPERFTPQKGTFGVLEDQDFQTKVCQKERIQRPWLGRPDSTRTLLVRANPKPAAPKELEEGFIAVNGLGLFWIKTKWAIAGFLGGIGLRKLRKRVLKHAAYIKIQPQNPIQTPPTIMRSDGNGVFDIK